MKVKPNHKPDQQLPRLIADIGGTNARFALLTSTGEITQQRQLLCAQYEEFVDAIEAYLAQVDHPQIEAAAIAIANPVYGDKVKMTNHHWGFSIEQTRQALNLRSLTVKNDLSALAMSIPTLPAHELKQLGGKPSTYNTPLAVIAPGTGLGVSGLIKTDEGWIALQSEGGHVSLSPGNDREAAILGHYRGRSEHVYGAHVSDERFISGPGIKNLYQVICDLDGAACEDISAREISSRAMAQTDPRCKEVMDTFCGLLGSIAGDLVLTLGAYDGLYIGGGIVASLGSYFERSPFRSRFEAKGRYQDRLHQVPVYVIHSLNPTLSGISQVFNNWKQKTDV